MKPTQQMVDAFSNADFSGMGNADREDVHVRAGLEAVLAMPEFVQLERFARAAAEHACSDSVDDWNELIDVWNSLTGEMQRGLLAPESEGR